MTIRRWLAFVWLLVGMASLATGCVPIRKTYGLAPEYPPLALTVALTSTVDNLRPAFRWKAATADGTTYDLAIWKPHKIESLNTWRWLLGSTVYYVENLKETQHTINLDLEPSTLYFWSVRQRRGSTVGPWSSYDMDIILPGSHVIERNHVFHFKTPKK